MSQENSDDDDDDDDEWKHTHNIDKWKNNEEKQSMYTQEDKTFRGGWGRSHTLGKISSGSSSWTMATMVLAKCVWVGKRIKYYSTSSSSSYDSCFTTRSR